MEDNGMKEYWEIKAQGVVGGHVGLTRSDFLAFGSLADIMNIKSGYLYSVERLWPTISADVVSVNILLRLVSATRLINNLDREPFTPYRTLIVDAAMAAVNNYISEVCLGGQTRLQKVHRWTVYDILVANSRMSDDVKFLPNPEVALAELFLMVNKEKINPEAYL